MAGLTCVAQRGMQWAAGATGRGPQGVPHAHSRSRLQLHMEHGLGSAWPHCKCKVGTAGDSGCWAEGRVQVEGSAQSSFLWPQRPGCSTDVHRCVSCLSLCLSGLSGLSWFRSSSPRLPPRTGQSSWWAALDNSGVNAQCPQGLWSGTLLL